MGVAEAVASRPDVSLPLVELVLGSAARSAAWASWAWADDGPAAVEFLESAEPEPCAGTARFDVAGSGVIAELIELTGDAERVVSIADFGAGALGAKVTGGEKSERAFDVLAVVAEKAEAGGYRVELQQVLPLDDAAEAHRLVETGHVRGKVVLTV